MKDEYISAYRRRITVAALRRMKRKTGSNLLTVKRHDGELTTIEITEQFISQLLLRFEGVTRGEFGRKDVKQQYALHTRMLSVSTNMVSI